MAAVIAVCLGFLVVDSLNIRTIGLISQIVLCWLKHNKNLKTFILNTKIQGLGLGNNHETVIIVPSWSHDNCTVKIF